MNCDCKNIGVTRIKDLHYGEDFDHCITIYISYCKDCDNVISIDSDWVRY